MPTTLIVHERLARWTRRLRFRVDDWGARLVESRSTEDLAAAATTTACPVVLIDPAGNPSAALAALLTVRRAAPQALVLVIDEVAAPDFPTAAREAGASLVLPSNSPLPIVFDLVGGWMDVAAKRTQADGWAADRRVVPEPWEAFLCADDRDVLNPTQQPAPTAP